MGQYLSSYDEDAVVKETSNPTSNIRDEDAVVKETPASTSNIRVVCISDTHGDHENEALDMPEGDLLIHAGDFTSFSKLEQAVRFNEWLGEVKLSKGFQHIVVINGNHESNADWKQRTPEILSNATAFLKDDQVKVSVEGKGSLTIHGTQFYWPMQTPNPHYDLIGSDVDLLVCHGPCKGLVDGGSGCKMLRKKALELPKLQLCVSGHIHGAYGVVKEGGKTFVNAANCGSGRKITKPAIEVEVVGRKA